MNLFQGIDRKKKGHQIWNYEVGKKVADYTRKFWDRILDGTHKEVEIIESWKNRHK